MPAAPTDWAGRLRFGQRVAGDAYLRLHRDHPRGGRDTVEAPILDAGSVRVDVGQVPRRSCSVRVRERDLPSWLGPTTQIELGARLPSQRGIVEVPVIVGHLGDPISDGDPGSVSMEIESPDAVPRGHELVGPRLMSGTALGSAISLLRGSLPGVGISVDPQVRNVAISAQSLDAGANRWDDGIARLAASCAAEVGATRTGGIAVRPTAPAGDPAWVLAEGVHHAGLSRSWARQPNLVVVTGVDGVRGWAVDDRPYSPGYVGPDAAALSGSPDADPPATAGYAPIRTRREDLPVSSRVDAQIAARGLLLRGVRSADWRLTCVWNPWLDWGDLILADAGGETYALVVTGIDITPYPSSTMTVTVRSL